MNKLLPLGRGRASMLLRGITLALGLECCLLNLLFASSGNAQDLHLVTIQFAREEMTISEIFQSIEASTDFNFSYSNKAMPLSRKVKISSRETTVGATLDQIASTTSLEFKQANYTIMVKAAANTEIRTRASVAIGIVRGRVTDAQTSEVLPGASVLIKGTATGTTTDVNGEYLLRVPEGDVALEISYIGYAILSETVAVGGAQTTEHDIKLTSDFKTLDNVVITGSLMGQQKALNQQKTADNIKNIVSADQIGRFPDPNVAEALQRVPGVNIERDQGEGRYVLVRGLAPQFTNVSINGEQIPSPEAGVRFVALDAVPADQLASIEVTKALTPDMDGDAIGGSVNLITRTAQSENLGISASALAGYNNLVQKANFQGSLELSKRFLKNKLGVMLNSSYYVTDRGSDDWERDDNDLELRDYILQRTRLGLSGTIDYRFDDKNEIYFRTIYNRFTDHEVRRRYVFVPNVDDSPFEDNTIERYTKDRLEKQSITSYNLGAKHDFNKFRLDYEIAYAEAIQDTPFDVEIGSVGEVDALTIDFATNPEFPSFTVDDIQQNNSENPYLDNTMYEFDEFVVGRTYALDVNKTAKMNITVPFKAGTGDGLIKFGGKVRLKEKEYRVSENVFGWTGGDVTFAGFEPGDYTLEKYAGGLVDDDFLSGRYTLRASADPSKVISHFNANPDGYELDVEDKLTAEALEAYTATEDVYAGYVMAKLQFKKLMLLGGARYEYTKVGYTSSEVIYNFEDELEDIVPVRGSTDYGFFLPQLHAKYAIDNNTNVRLALTRTYARPNFQDIIPSQEITFSAREGTIGNPDLKPVDASNIDLMVERYFGNVGILSGGFFYKNLDNFIFNRRFESTNYPGAEGVDLTLTQAQNGDRADLVGFEVAYQQNLTFLPGFLKGLSVYANYTYTSSEARIQSRENTSGTETIRLPGQARNVGNLSLAYDHKRVNFRIASNFNGEYLSEVGGDASEDLFVKQRVQLDATATVAVTQRLRLFAEFLNITNQPFEVYMGDENHYIQREFYSWWSRVGLKFDL
ncbi:MAG TPA: TonB-dependent receptor [Chryseolinea sp.]|nr:TonB-dependent receptor [Chryseolinea sp.]